MLFDDACLNLENRGTGGGYLGCSERTLMHTWWAKAIFTATSLAGGRAHTPHRPTINSPRLTPNSEVPVNFLRETGGSFSPARAPRRYRWGRGMPFALASYRSTGREAMTSIDKEGFVEFRFFRRNVGGVRIVGDFDQAWDGALDMTPGPDGWWAAKVAVRPGEYRFRYVADGDWYTDYASNGIEVTKSGVNSVLVVPERPATPRAAAKMVA